MEFPQRKHTRLHGYDYSRNGVYFVTICTYGRQQILSTICRGGALLLPVGRTVETEIMKLQDRFGIIIDKYVIMPNHVHMIVTIQNPVEREEQSPSPTGTLSNIVCALKSITTKIAHQYGVSLGQKIWQRSFHDHIIRNEPEYCKIWEYIDTNPQRWENDCFYENNCGG